MEIPTSSQKAYYLFGKSILPFGEEVGTWNFSWLLICPLKQCLNAV